MHFMKELINPESWRNSLSSNLPGEKAQRMMAPEFRGEPWHQSDPVRAAVLILMYAYGDRISLALIKRNVYEGPHSAQVSFPGGAWEESDGSLKMTALRETREELGINEKVTVLGTLTGLYIPVSNFMVTPFVGYLNHRPLFHPDPTEVQYVIEAPLESLMDPVNRRSETVSRNGQYMVVPYYSIKGEKIWGATAMILSEYLQLASRMP